MGTSLDKRLRGLRTTTRLDASLSELARELALKSGIKLPLKPNASNEDARRQIAVKLGTSLWNVTEALRGRKLNVTPEQLANRAVRRVEAVKDEAERRVRRALLEAEEAVARAEEIERKAKERLENARQKEQASKPDRRRYGTAKYEFKSQQLPQIPAVLFGDDQSWVMDGISAYREAFCEEHGVPIDQAKVVRLALEEMLAKPKSFDPMAKTPGGPNTLRSVRLAAGSEGLLDQLRSVAQRKGVRDSDVIRGALAAWLTGKGYGQRKRGK